MNFRTGGTRSVRPISLWPGTTATVGVGPAGLLKSRMASTHTAELVDDKLRSRKQWSEDPCGEVYGKGLEFGTREFFDEVERHRYQEYAPWMPEVMGFDTFGGARLVEVGCGMGTDLLQFAR